MLHFCEKAPPIVLVGTKVDLRTDEGTASRLREKGLSAVSGEEAEALATEIGAVMYVETSSLRQLGVRYACSAGWYCAHSRHVVAQSCCFERFCTVQPRSTPTRCSADFLVENSLGTRLTRQLDVPQRLTRARPAPALCNNSFLYLCSHRTQSQPTQLIARAHGHVTRTATVVRRNGVAPVRSDLWKENLMLFGVPRNCNNSVRRISFKTLAALWRARIQRVQYRLACAAAGRAWPPTALCNRSYSPRSSSNNP